VLSRRSFIKSISTVTLLPIVAPVAIPANDCYTLQELTGQVRPYLTGNGFELRKETARAFVSMQQAAAKDGIKIKVVSSYRSYARQKGIWDRKYTKYTKQGYSNVESIEKIIEYSTIPGTSRHHWGTDVDIIDGSKSIPKDPLHAKHFQKGGIYEDLYEWLTIYSEAFGFYETYTNDPNRKGFKYEPWHYSFLDTSLAILEEYLHIDLYSFLRHASILGHEYISHSFMDKYIEENILGINKNLIV